MYYLFKEHHLLPGQYDALPAGEKAILRAFFQKDMEVRAAWQHSK